MESGCSFSPFFRTALGSCLPPHRDRKVEAGPASSFPFPSASGDEQPQSTIMEHHHHQLFRSLPFLHPCLCLAMPSCSCPHLAAHVFGALAIWGCVIWLCVTRLCIHGGRGVYYFFAPPYGEYTFI